MNPPKVTVLVHGGPSSIEMVRVRGLTRRHPPERLRILSRSGGIAATWKSWSKDLGEFPPDVAYVLNTAAPGAISAPLWRWTRGLPFILDTGDAVHAMAKASGIGAGWKLPLLWTFERLSQRTAAAVVVRGSGHRLLLASQGCSRVEVIRDGYSEQQKVSPESVESLRRKLGLEGRFVAGLMGSTVMSPRLGICYGWDLLEAMVSLKDQPVTALVIGDGTGLPWLKSRARVLGVEDRVLFTGRIPYDDVPRYLRLLDVALSTQTNNLPGRVRTTGKLPEYMAAGCFVLASRVGDAEILLPEPMLVDYQGEVDRGYPARLARRIREVMASEELRRLASDLPLRAERLCSYGILSEQWSRLVAEISGWRRSMSSGY